MHNTRKKNEIISEDISDNVLFVGVGGQGIVLASDILALAAMYSGHDVKKSEIHGMSQRGGSVFAHVRFGIKVFSPVVGKHDADVIVSLEEMETLRWLDYAQSSTKFIIVKTRIQPSGAKTYPEDTVEYLKREYKEVVTLDPAELAQKVGGPKFINVAVLGALSKYLDIRAADVQRAIIKCVPEGTAGKNIASFQLWQERGIAMIFNEKQECMTGQELKNWQSYNLTALVERLYEKVPFYKSKLDDEGVKPKDIKSITDISKAAFYYQGRHEAGLSIRPAG